MSHHDDNLYTILGKLAALQPAQETSKEAAKKIYESVEAQGSILQGVDSVQARLAQQFAEANTNEAVRVAGNTKGPVGHYSHMKHVGKDGSPEAQAHRDATAAMAKSARAAGSKLPFNKTTEPSGKLASGGYNAMTKGVTPVRTSAEECAMCEAGTCNEHTNEAAEITRKDNVTIHRKTDFPGYPVDDNDDIEDVNKGKRGRPRKHAVQVAKTDAEGNKLGRGRPKKDAAPVYSKMNDPFGRVPAKAPKVKGPVIRHTMDEAMAAMSDRLHRITEGVNFANLLKEKHQTLDEMLAELSRDMKVFKETGHCSELLKDCMEIKGYHGKLVTDEASNPNNPFYKKQNDYNLPPSMRGHGTPDYKVPDVKAHDNIERDSYRDRAGLSPLDTALEDELNTLAELAGITRAAEGNAFTGKLKDTSKGDTFDLDGKQYTDTSTLDEGHCTDCDCNPCECNEGNEFSGELAKARAQHKDSFDVDGKEYPVQEEKIDVDSKGANPVNAPRPKYGTIKQITSQGDDLNRQKKQDPHTANRAANPLTNVATLESRLAAEYESIKKVTK